MSLSHGEKNTGSKIVNLTTELQQQAGGTEDENGVNLHTI